MRLPLNQLTRGDRFQGADAAFWTVLKNEAGTITAIRTGRPSFTAPAGDQLVEVTNRDDDDEMTNAVAAVVEAMPGAEVTNRDDDDEMTQAMATVALMLAQQYPSIHEIRSHIELMHGQYAGDIRTTKQLTAEHAEMHDQGVMKVDHLHGDMR